MHRLWYLLVHYQTNVPIVLQVLYSQITFILVLWISSFTEASKAFSYGYVLFYVTFISSYSQVISKAHPIGCMCNATKVQISVSFKSLVFSMGVRRCLWKYLIVKFEVQSFIIGRILLQPLHKKDCTTWLVGGSSFEVKPCFLLGSFDDTSEVIYWYKLLTFWYWSGLYFVPFDSFHSSFHSQVCRCAVTWTDVFRFEC